MKKSDEPKRHEMLGTLDHDALGKLVLFLEQNRGRQVAIDGANVERVGALAAQILTLSGKTWAADNVAFIVNDPAGKIAESFATMGLSHLWAEITQPQGAKI